MGRVGSFRGRLGGKGLPQASRLVPPPAPALRLCPHSPFLCDTNHTRLEPTLTTLCDLTTSVKAPSPHWVPVCQAGGQGPFLSPLGATANASHKVHVRVTPLLVSGFGRARSPPAVHPLREVWAPILPAGSSRI